VTDLFAVLIAHGTSAVSDALDVRGLPGGLPGGLYGGLFGLRRMSGSGGVAGPAFTVLFEPVPPGEAGQAADFIDDVPPGAVVVLGNAGRHCTVWGDILGRVALGRSLAGTVIDGYCRDVDGLRELGYSVWARGGFMRSGKNRVRMAAVQVPMAIGDGPEAVTVHPGDAVCADGSGVVVVPAAAAGEIAERVARIAAMEALVLAEVTSGVPLREARARHGYNAVARWPAG
jgi:regulator of RNase E activity RraA